MSRSPVVATALCLGALCVGALLVADPALAHTETDYVAVPAGGASTVSLRPTHGCGDSPTVTVRVRSPLPDVVAGEVEGWTASTTPDGEGRTVLEWTGGVLPADQEGAFPVEFTAPDAPGDLLTFPSVQRCENGDELAWLSGDPAAEYPAPRVLILPAGLEPALTLDDVPADALGREKLVEVIDVDNPNAPPPTVPAPTTAVPPPVETTTLVPATTARSVTSNVATTIDDDESGSSAGPIIAAVVAAVAVAAIAAAVLLGRRH